MCKMEWESSGTNPSMSEIQNHAPTQSFLFQWNQYSHSFDAVEEERYVSDRVVLQWCSVCDIEKLVCTHTLYDGMRWPYDVQCMCVGGGDGGSGGHNGGYSSTTSSDKSLTSQREWEKCSSIYSILRPTALNAHTCDIIRSLEIKYKHCKIRATHSRHCGISMFEWNSMDGRNFMQFPLERVTKASQEHGKLCGSVWVRLFYG